MPLFPEHHRATAFSIRVYRLRSRHLFLLRLHQPEHTPGVVGCLSRTQQAFLSTLLCSQVLVCKISTCTNAFSQPHLAAALWTLNDSGDLSNVGEGNGSGQ